MSEHPAFMPIKTLAMPVLSLLIGVFLIWFVLLHGYLHVRWVCVHENVAWKARSDGLVERLTDKTTCGFQSRYSHKEATP